MRTAFSLIVTLYAASAFAVDATWVHTNSATTASWYALANWVDANGDTLEVLPTNITDTVTLAPLPHSIALQTKMINTPLTKKDWVDSDCNPQIASLAGERAYRVEHTQRQSGLVTIARQMYIGNPDSFFGYLSVGDSRASYAFGATPSYSPLVHNLDPYRRVGLDVVEAGTTVKVARVACGGFIEKTGDGALSIESTTGVDNSAYVKGGSLELVGRGEEDDAIDEILANALLHLDASVASTLETNMVDESGNVCVTRWRDVRGGNWPYAVTNSYTSVDSPYYFPYTRAPYIAAETSPSGRRMVSFGSNVNVDGDSLGPTNCLLQLSSKLTTVREAFTVILAPRGLAYCTVLGDTYSYDFIRYTTDYIGEKKAVEDLMINGVRSLNGKTAAEMNAMTNAFVSAILMTGNSTVSLLGSDRHYRGRSGGTRIGEIILLDTPVTDAQRQRISRMLVEKWLGTPDVSLGRVVAESGTTLSVPDGNIARVGTVKIQDDVLTKEGGGTLSIGSLQGMADMTVKVNGGTISFREETPVPDSSAPADGPSLWLDATKTSSFSEANTHAGNDHTYYARWKDCRDGFDQAATWPAGLTTNEPFLVENAAGAGLHVLSFGLNGALNGSWMQLPDFNTGKEDVYAGFIVCRANTTSFNVNHFGSSTIEMRRETNARLLSASYVQVRPYSAVWSVDGVLADPLANRDDLKQTKDFHVIAFSSEYPLCVDSLCKDRIAANAYQGNCGGLQIGEFILYKRRLTEAERTRTEAYLMDKWLNARHPDDVSDGHVVKAVDFAPDTAASIGSDGDVTVGTVTGGNGTLVKKGSGTVEINALKSDISSVDVEGGVLDASPSAIPMPPRFRFDASAAGSVEHEIVDNGDGTSRTNVTKWLDADGNGFYAIPPATFAVPGVQNGALISTNPTLVTLETRTCVTRPAVDFGPYSGYYTNSQHAGTAGLSIYNANGTAVGGNNCCILEAFIVCEAEKNAFILNDSSAYHYHRNGANILTSNAGTQAGSKDGYVAVDGVQVPYNTAIDAKAHLINFAPTNVTAINRIAWDRTSNAGGMRIFEMICYTNSLTMAQRKSVENLLMNKWFGTAKPTCTYSSVRVAPGAMLRQQPTDVIVAADVTLGGTVAGAAAISGVTTLTIPCENGIPVTSVQQVPIGFADGTVQVTLDGFDARAFNRAGYVTTTLLEAPSFSGNATFVLTNNTGSRRANLKASDGRLVLTVLPPSLSISFR